MKTCKYELDGEPACKLGTLTHQVQIYGDTLACVPTRQPSAPSKHKIMVIAKAPDMHDIMSIGKGRNIEKLMDLCALATLDTRDVYVTGLVKCAPPKRPPTVQEVKACMGHLADELKAVQPEVVVLMGTDALRAFNLMGQGGVNSLHGKVHELKFPHDDDMDEVYKVVVTTDPNALYMNPDPKLEGTMVKDLRVAKAAVEGDLRCDTAAETHYKLIENMSDLAWMVEKIQERGMFAFDTESRGLPWSKEPLICLQFTWGYDPKSVESMTAVLPIYNHDPAGTDWKLKSTWSKEDKTNIIRMLRIIFEDENIPKIAHNIKYDMCVVRKHLDGIVVKGFLFDTMCVPGDVEVMTHEGWVPFKNLKDNTPVMQWDNKDRKLSFCEDTIVKRFNYDGKMISAKSAAHTCMYTPEHRIPVMWQSKEIFTVKSAEDASKLKAWYLPTSGKWTGGHITFPGVRLMAAIQADGRISYNKVVFEFSKNRKVKRLQHLCSELDIPIVYYKSKRNTTIMGIGPSPIIDNIKNMLGSKKVFGSWLLTYTNETLANFIDEIKYWDSHIYKAGGFTYSSKYKENCEWVSTLAHLLDKSSRLYKSGGVWTASIRDRYKRSIRSEHFTEVPYNDKVYCVTVDTGFFLARSDGQIFVTGNCMHHLLWEHPPHDLEYLSDLELSTGDYSKALHKITGRGKVLKRTYDYVPDELMWKYGSKDSENVYRLMCIYFPRLQAKPHLWQLYQDEVHPFIRTLFKAEWYGCSLSHDVIDTLTKEFKDESVALMAKIKSATWPEFNPSSSADVAKAITNAGYFSDIEDKRRAKGYTTNKQTLLRLAPKFPVVEDILRFRTLTKLTGTYMSNAKKLANGDGRARIGVMIHGTVNGRVSAPFLHQIPRLDMSRVEKGLGNLRDMFVAKPGSKIVYGDFSQIELVTLAIQAGDADMLEVFRSGEDIHAATAAAFLDVPLDKVDDFNRSIGKSINFGRVYGSVDGYALMKLTYKDQNGHEHPITEAMVRRGFASLDERFPAAATYFEDTVAEISANHGTYITRFGREKHMGTSLCSGNEWMRKEAERQAVNGSIQSPANSVTVRTLNAVDAHLEELILSGDLTEDEIFLIITVHDSGAWETKTNHIEWFVPKLKEIASRKIPQLDDFQFTMKVGIGDSWSEAELNAE